MNENLLWKWHQVGQSITINPPLRPVWPKRHSRAKRKKLTKAWLRTDLGHQYYLWQLCKDRARISHLRFMSALGDISLSAYSFCRNELHAA